jgi:hypothetical protein
MICGRNPWKKAITSDPCFDAYIRDKNFLRTALPISGAAFLILKRIFTLNPQRRITIPDLRKEILLVDTFYKTEMEQAAALPPINPPRRQVPSSPKPPRSRVFSPFVHKRPVIRDESSSDGDILEVKVQAPTDYRPLVILKPTSRAPEGSPKRKRPVPSDTPSSSETESSGPDIPVTPMDPIEEEASPLGLKSPPPARPARPTASPIQFARQAHPFRRDTKVMSYRSPSSPNLNDALPPRRNGSRFLHSFKTVRLVKATLSKSRGELSGTS